MNMELSELSYKERTFSGLFAVFFAFMAGLTAFLILLPFGFTVCVIGALVSVVVTLLSHVLVSPVIEVSKSHLRVGNATIPTKYLGEIEVITKERAFAERGVGLDARAYRKFVLGVPTLVKIKLRDQADPTPYWLFSSKNPELLVRILKKS
jgi:Protein of unknown function (DUF3093)